MNDIAIITGSAGLVGSECARYFHEKGMRIVGIDNGMRSHFFGKAASVDANAQRLKADLERYEHRDVNVVDAHQIQSLFGIYGPDTAVVIHAAGQPSHDWAATHIEMDFAVNALGTLNVLQAAWRHCPRAVFIYVSTNKVYGDSVNCLPLSVLPSRYDLEYTHPYARYGIPETMPIDHSLHSFMGVSKLAADIMVQEYARNLGLKAGVFRCGCITGAAHAGAKQHGFLAYLAKCARDKRLYHVHGYNGKQVRDNIHAADLAAAFWEFFQEPKGIVYNMGGGMRANVSVIEAIDKIERMQPVRLSYNIGEHARKGDHKWWISDTRKFCRAYPNWKPMYGIDNMLTELLEKPCPVT